MTNTTESGTWTIREAAVTFSVAGVDTYHLTTGGLNSTTLTVLFNGAASEQWQPFSTGNCGLAE